jgi:protoporphyrinogen oxidase
MSKIRQVVILGAGPGGLAAGHWLARHGIRPLVFEKLNYVGGLCHTIVRDGFRFDIGGHRWFTKNDELNQWFISLMGDELIKVERISRIYFDGKYFSYPVGIKNVLANAGVFTSLHAVVSYMLAQVKAVAKDQEPTNMEEAYVKQFGRKLYEMFFQCYSEKVWGQSCTKISADWVEQRTKGLSISAAIRNAVVKSKNVASIAEEFLYPALGYSRISERMAEDMQQNGGQLLLNHRVLSVLHENEEITGITFEDPSGKVQSVQADAVVSTIPLTVLARNLTPKPPAEVFQAASKLRFRDLITINIMLNRETVTNDTWLYIHDKRIPFARLHEPKNWSMQMVPPGKTSIVAELFCTIGDELWSQSDEDLCKLTIHHLSDTLRMIKKDEVIGAFAFRAPQAYPIYDLDYQSNLQAIKDYIATIHGLQIIGRGGTFRYNNSDHSIEMGLMAAKNLLGGSYRLDAVNEAREYLEEKRVNSTARG